MTPDYFGSPAISSSDIAGVKSVVEFYQRKFINPKVRRDYFDIGTACHAFILEPETFNTDVKVFKDFPEPDKINKDGTVSKTGANGKAFDAFKELHKDKIVFEQTTFDNVLSYAQSIKNIPGFDNLIDLSKGIAEHTFYTKDDPTGLDIKLKPDYIKPGKYILDLKFMAKVNDFEIAKSFKEYEYHLRAAFYLDFYNQLSDDKIKNFIYVCVEKSDNPRSRILNLSEIDINAGRGMYRDKLDAIAKCMHSGEWIESSIEHYKLPEWVYQNNFNF